MFPCVPSTQSVARFLGAKAEPRLPSSSPFCQTRTPLLELLAVSTNGCRGWVSRPAGEKSSENRTCPSPVVPRNREVVELPAEPFQFETISRWLPAPSSLATATMVHACPVKGEPASFSHSFCPANRTTGRPPHPFATRLGRAALSGCVAECPCPDPSRHSLINPSASAITPRSARSSTTSPGTRQGSLGVGTDRAGAASANCACCARRCATAARSSSAEGSRPSARCHAIRAWAARSSPASARTRRARAVLRSCTNSLLSSANAWGATVVTSRWAHGRVVSAKSNTVMNGGSRLRWLKM